MTKEESIEILKDWDGYFVGHSSDDVNEALNTAIKALEQEPKLGKDGTLVVTTEHYKNVSRVLVQHGTNGTLFYQDELREESEEE